MQMKESSYKFKILLLTFMRRNYYVRVTIIVHEVIDHFVIDLSHFALGLFGGLFFCFGLVFEVPEVEYF